MKKYNKIYGLYVEKSEQDLIKHIAPEYYIDKSIDKNNIDKEYAQRFLQNQLNELLNSFVNGGFSYKGYLFYPFVKDISKENIRKIKRLRKVAVFLNNNNHSFSRSINQFKKKINNKNFALILSSLYLDLSQIKNNNTKLIKKPKCKEFDIKNYKKSDLEYLKPLDKLKDYAEKKLRRYALGFYLHGSLATKDYIKGWSDVDTTIIISKKTLKEPENLLELRNKLYCVRKFFYRIDPLQHHGSIVISEYDMENYCQAYFPIPVFRYGLSFFRDDKTMNFKVRSFSSEALKKIFWFVSYFRKLNYEKNYNLSSYDTKELLHAATLFPTLYLQAKGSLMYKKFSFVKAKKDFKKDIWEVVDNVSSIRSHWKGFGTIPSVNLFSRVNPLLCYRLNARIMDIFKDIKKMNNINTKKLINDMSIFSEEAWIKIKKNVKNKRL